MFVVLYKLKKWPVTVYRIDNYMPFHLAAPFLVTNEAINCLIVS